MHGFRPVVARGSSGIRLQEISLSFYGPCARAGDILHGLAHYPDHLPPAPDKPLRTTAITRLRVGYELAALRLSSLRANVPALAANLPSRRHVRPGPPRPAGKVDIPQFR